MNASSTSAPKHLDTVLIAASIVGAFFVAFFAVGRPLWLDDSHSTFFAAGRIQDVIPHLYTDAHPPLYFLLLSVWMDVFGQSEFALRTLSILCYFGTVAAIAVLGTKLWGRTAGVFAGVAYLVSALAIGQSQTVRMYSLVGLLAALSTGILLTMVKEQKPSRTLVASYIAVTMLGTFTHYWFFFLMMAQGLAVIVLAHDHWKRIALSLVAATIPFVVFWVPVLRQQLEGNSSGWNPPSPADLVLTFGIFYGGASKSMLVYGALAVVCFVHIQGGRPVLLLRQTVTTLSQDRQVRLLLLIAIATVAIPFLGSQVKPMFHVRYAIAALPPFAMLLGYSLSLTGDRWLRYAWCFGILGSVIVSTYLGRSVPPVESDRAGVEYLLRHYQPSDQVVVTSLSGGPISHYLRYLAPDRVIAWQTYPAELKTHIGWRYNTGMLARRSEIEAEADSIVNRLRTHPNAQRLWLFYGNDTHVSHILKDRLDAHFTLADSVEQVGTAHKAVLLYQK